MASMPTPSPYSSSTVTSQPSALVQQLAGLSANSPAYSPFQALSRQGSNEAKMIEGMTSNPTWSSIYAAYGVPEGTDLTPYIRATQTGTASPTTMGTSPIPQSPAAGSIPAYVPPSKEESVGSTKKAAAGGLMSLAKKRGFASGGSSVKQLSSGQQNDLNNLQKIIDAGGTLSPAQQTKYNYMSGVNQAYQASQQQAQNDQAGQPPVPLSQAMNVVTPFYDPTQAQGQYAGVTNPIYQQAINQLQAASNAPSQIGQGTGIMSQASQDLLKQAGFTPQQVQAQQATAQGYNAALMQAPQDIQAQGYTAAQMQGGPNVQAVNVGTNQMAGPQSWTTPGTSQQYMDPYIQNVLNTQLQLANQQNAIQNNQLRGQAAQSKAYGGAREQLALGQQQMNQNLANQNMVQQALSQAYQSGLGQFNTAQGQALQAGQANLAAAQQSALANQTAGMTAQQLNQLYGQGGYNAQAANQAAQNAQMQQYVQNELAAAQTNYGGQLTAAQQNQVAQNAAAQFLAQAQNTASLQNAQLGTQASIQNQQAGLTGQGLNLQALNQAGAMGQGIGSLGTSTWGLQQNVPGMWGSAGSIAQNLAQQAATGAQQTAQNWWGGMNSAYQPVTNLLGSFGGTTSTTNTSRIPGVTA